MYLADYDSPRAAHTGLARYFEFYNHRRPHQALDYRTPAEVYRASSAPIWPLTTTTTTT